MQTSESESKKINDGSRVSQKKAAARRKQHYRNCWALTQSPISSSLRQIGKKWALFEVCLRLQLIQQAALLYEQLCVHMQQVEDVFAFRELRVYTRIRLRNFGLYLEAVACDYIVACDVHSKRIIFQPPKEMPETCEERRLWRKVAKKGTLERNLSTDFGVTFVPSVAPEGEPSNKQKRKRQNEALHLLEIGRRNLGNVSRPKAKLEVVPK